MKISAMAATVVMCLLQTQEASAQFFDGKTINFGQMSED